MMHLFTALLLAVLPAAPTHFVTDLSHALSPQTASTIETQLHDYQQKTGHQVIVYVAPSTGGEALESFTSEAGHRWHVGQKGKDDGAILFLFTQDRKVRIEVGYGLESVLTDAQSKRIIADDIVPKMKAGDANAAVQQGVNGMLAAIDGAAAPASDSSSSAPSDSDSNDGIGVLVIVLLFIVFPIALFAGLGMLIAHFIRKSLGLKPGQHLVQGASGLVVTTTSSSGFDWGGGGGGFSGGGGDFGGGGASGSW